MTKGAFKTGRRELSRHRCGVFEFADSACHDRTNMCTDMLDRPVPPRHRQQTRDLMIGIAPADQPGRIAADDTVVGRVVDDHGARRNDRAVADVDTGHYQDVMTDPYIVANDGVTFVWQPSEQVAVFCPGP